MGLNFFPRVVTPNALGVLSRNQNVVCFADGSAGDPKTRAGVGLVLKFGFYTVEVARPIKPPVSSYFVELQAIELACDLFPLDRKLFINSDCLNLVNIMNGTHKAKKIPRLIARVVSKLKDHNAEVRFIPKTNRAGAHNRADRLATKARLDGRNFFRVTTI